MNAPQPQTQLAQAAHAVAGEPNDFERLLQRNFSPQDLMQGDNLDRIDRIAQRMAAGKMTVPQYLQGSIGDCMAIAMQAMLWNMDPFAVAQKTHIVSGRLGYEAQLVNAVLQNSGAVRGLPRYEYRGEGGALECRVGFVPRGETEVLWNEFLKISDIQTKNSPLWKVNPKQQIGYLQIKNWARAYAPGAILGVYTVDELEDMPPAAARTPSPAPAPAPRPELPPYDQAAFDKNLPGWQKLVTGKDGKTAEALLAKLSTKATFTDEQKAKILALKPQAEDATPAAASAPAADDSTAAFVADMNAAETAQGAAQ